MSKENKNTEVIINCPAEVVNGHYANFSIIQHSYNEFVLDFLASLPGMNGPNVVSRIVMNPTNIKLLAEQLKEQIRVFESTFGPIQLPQQSNMPNLPPSNAVN